MLKFKVSRRLYLMLMWAVLQSFWPASRSASCRQWRSFFPTPVIVFVSSFWLVCCSMLEMRVTATLQSTKWYCLLRISMQKLECFSRFSHMNNTSCPSHSDFIGLLALEFDSRFSIKESLSTVAPVCWFPAYGPQPSSIHSLKPHLAQGPHSYNQPVIWNSRIDNTGPPHSKWILHLCLSRHRPERSKVKESPLHNLFHSSASSQRIKTKLQQISSRQTSQMKYLVTWRAFTVSRGR
jgi:hypothetical protein